jgi:hypothetical protein
VADGVAAAGTVTLGAAVVAAGLGVDVVEVAEASGRLATCTGDCVVIGPLVEVG